MKKPLVIIGHGSKSFEDWERLPKEERGSYYVDGMIRSVTVIGEGWNDVLFEIMWDGDLGYDIRLSNGDRFRIEAGGGDETTYISCSEMNGDVEEDV